jgi:hypothetical protein
MRRRSSKVTPNHAKSQNIYNLNGSDSNTAKDLDGNKSKEDFVNRSEIKKRAIQVFYTEGIGKKGDFITPYTSALYYNILLHPNGSVRRFFDFITVIWVLILVFAIPFLIGFDWYAETKGQKIFLNLLDIWFAIDIVLNFRTGYIHHGTIIMTPKKIVW